MAHTLGPCRRAKRWAKLSGSALMMKLISPWRYSVTALWRCFAIGLKPMRSNSAPMAAGSGAAYSMNSKPSVPMGFSHVVAAEGTGAFMVVSLWCGAGEAPLYRRSVSRFQRFGALRLSFLQHSCRIEDMQALDKLDRHILRSLQADGRATYDQIAEVVGLSPSAVLRRVKRLEEVGVIERYVALVRPEAVGLGLTAYVNVRLEKHAESAKRNPMDLFRASVQGWAEVVECAAL